MCVTLCSAVSCFVNISVCVVPSILIIATEVIREREYYWDINVHNI